MPNVLSKLDEVVKPHFLGIGFVWAWIYCAFDTPAVYPSQAAIGTIENPAWLASAVVVVISLFLFGAMFAKMSVSFSKHLAWVAALLMAIGTLVSAFVAEWRIAMLLCGGMTGIGSAMLIIMWGSAFVCMDADSTEVAIPASYAVMLACTLIFPYIEGIVGVVGVASLPLISSLCLTAVFDGFDGEEGLQSRRGFEGYNADCGDVPDAKGSSVKSLRDANPHSSPFVFEVAASVKSSSKMPLFTALRLLILVFSAYFVIGFVSASIDSPHEFQMVWGFDASTFIGSIAGLALAVWFILHSRRVDLSSLFRWLSPTMVIGCAMIAFDSELSKFLLATMICVADTVLQVVAMLYFVGLVRRGRISASMGVGVSQGTIQLGVLTGQFVAPLVIDLGPEPWIVAIGLMCVLSIAMAFAPSAYSDDLPAFDGAGRAPEDDEEEGRRKAILASLTQKKGLSARESEILDYLSKGRSQPYIRDELVLSKNTVATHVKHIYQKLGVHSRQELLDLFESSHDE